MKKTEWVATAALLSALALGPQWAVRNAYAQDVVGIWRSQIATPYCPGMAETTLMPDGRFSKTFRCGEVFTLDIGTYTVGPGYIHFNIQDHEPKVWHGKRMHWLRSETVFFQFIGPDRMICNDRITGGRWEALRVR